jgi:hypothetical protein
MAIISIAESFSIISLAASNLAKISLCITINPHY